MLLPGAGQVYLGRTRLGAYLLAVIAALAVVVALLALQGPFVALALLVRPEVLLGLVAANVAFLVFRLFAVVDAYRDAPSVKSGSASRPGRGFGPTVVLAVLVVLTVVPHAVAGYFNLQDTTCQ
ncbi:MAG: hypothetical protein WKH64_06150 [Chloroflexia bacterium]